jgi:DNA-binding phage protein
MSVLNDIEKLMTADEIAENEKEYLLETAHLRAAQVALAQSLAQYISAVMKEKKISQNELKRQMGISSATMTEMVSGRGNPTLSTIAKVAHISGRKPKFVWE